MFANFRSVPVSLNGESTLHTSDCKRLLSDDKAECEMTWQPTEGRPVEGGAQPPGHRLKLDPVSLQQIDDSKLDSISLQQIDESRFRENNKVSLPFP